MYEESAEIYRHITGQGISAGDLRLAGERINNVKKMFNIREGWRRADDTLPRRVFEEALPTGVAAGVGLREEDLDMMVQGYYRARGWLADGTIPGTKLWELGLDDIGAGA